jgi:2-polyprenyl-3-methyl-5-hydroxy-6-metoxy-1,4-benzoquinol methylase/GT2 family glycosyltransferase
VAFPSPHLGKIYFENNLLARSSQANFEYADCSLSVAYFAHCGEVKLNEGCSVRFSLIVATLGRHDELGQLFSSLVRQTHTDFEVILVDQNPEGFLADILADYSAKLDIRYATSLPGLSRARNVGLRLAKGDAIAFPDDDCLYAPDTLSTAAADLEHADVVIATQYDSELLRDEQYCDCQINSTGTARVAKSVQLQKTDLFKNAASITLFFTAEAVVKAGLFDERIGAGAGTRWGAGEDTDYLLKAFAAGCTIVRAQAIRVYHPQMVYDGSLGPSKAMGYGRGRFFVLRKHRLPLWFIGANILFPFCKAATLINDIPACKFYLYLGIGRMQESLHHLTAVAKKAAKNSILFAVKAVGKNKSLCRFALKSIMGLHNACYTAISVLSPLHEADQLHPKHRIIRYHDWFVDSIDSGSRVLDIGCGNGTLTNALAEKAASVTGVDIVPGNIVRAESLYHLDNIQFFCADATVSIPEGEYDFVVLSNVLEHIEQRPKFLRALFSQMRQPYPTLLIRVPLIDRCWLPKYKKELGVEWRLDSTHFTEYTLAELKQELDAAGLAMVSVPEQRFGEVFVAVRPCVG